MKHISSFLDLKNTLGTFGAWILVAMIVVMFCIIPLIMMSALFLLSIHFLQWSFLLLFS